MAPEEPREPRKRKGRAVEPLLRTAVLSSSVVLIVCASDKFASDLSRGIEHGIDRYAVDADIGARIWHVGLKDSVELKRRQGIAR